MPLSAKRRERRDEEDNMDANTQSQSDTSRAKGMPDAAVKYRAYPQVNIPDRTWPTKTITKAPIW